MSAERRAHGDEIPDMRARIGPRARRLGCSAPASRLGIAGFSGRSRRLKASSSGLRARSSSTFTERLEPAYSTVRVKDDRGAQVDRQDAHVDPSNPLLLRVTLQPLERGDLHGDLAGALRRLSCD